MDVVATRVFDAPADQVWQAWSKAEYVHRWWGPDGFTAPIAEMDVREGGTSRVSMRSPEGHEFYNTWTYSRVIPRERLEFTMDFADSSWQPRSPAELGLPADIPVPVPHVVTFARAGAKTELTVTESGYTSPQTAEMSRLGLEQCLDKMAIALSAKEH
ncbi:SRPBCC domain-containing protein [Kibdelosporangium persicum]|uniref:Activator of HSP90 ATPase n=1 Tax=Kibdelosporangium persicum TaxID=2698649 RepID=A0ABX2F1L9_9PSEU|nr:SRPBCC domain-containing protein [Kibdelosporangium persicum]NRN65118.1 Activator of HSP90 ATPase [Kibdelosporangium persicum]